MIRYIPIQLIQYSLSNNRSKELRLLIFFKSESNTGLLSQSKEDISNRLSLLGISKRTYDRHVRALIDLKWIGKDKHQTLYLRGWKRLEMAIGLKFTSKVDFHYSYLTKKALLGYFMGAVISYQCKLKNYIVRKERKKGGSLLFHDLQHPLSISYLSNLLKIPKSTTQFYKTRAIKEGFVIRIKKIEKINIKDKNIDLRDLRKNWTEKTFPFYKDGYLMIMHSDNFKPRLHFKRYR